MVGGLDMNLLKAPISGVSLMSAVNNVAPVIPDFSVTAIGVLLFVSFLNLILIFLVFILNAATSLALYPQT